MLYKANFHVPDSFKKAKFYIETFSFMVVGKNPSDEYTKNISKCVKTHKYE